MENKYLLYIDILGFSNFVKNSPEDVRRIYSIIENLNCHKHSVFKVIVFSDTILIYNKEEPLVKADHEYIIMFLIEFAQNLLYETIGKNYYFRAILLYDTFEHTTPKKVERFFGKSLVRAYLDEKSIPSIGLFIENSINKYNNVFPTEKYDEQYSFVYLNQTLDEIIYEEMYGLPIPKDIISDTDLAWDLVYDIQMLKDIFNNMRYHKDIGVRQKFLLAWDFYERRYFDFLTQLRKADFSPKIICPNLNWGKYFKRIREGYRGYLIEPPSFNEYSNIIEEARKAGKVEAENECKKRFGTTDYSKIPFLPCGGSFIVLDVDPKNKLGRFLVKSTKKIKRVYSFYDKKRKGFTISIYDMHNSQARLFDEVSTKRGLKVLSDSLGLDGYVYSYWD